jgi:hypothetical protein
VQPARTSRRSGGRLRHLPRLGPEEHCARYGIEIRNVNSHHNTIGYSGTAGNGVWAHDNRFHHNATGMTTDSFASGHPGMPQDCAKWEHNRIYSNNEDYFNDERDAYCKQPPAKRNPNIVCPTFQVPVGTGIGIFGSNGDIVRDNWIYDNWRDGAKLLYVPAAFRGELDKGVDTSFDNTFVDLPDLRIRDASGEPVQAQPIFLATFGKSLWSPTRAPAQLPENELRRTGRLAWLEPGETAPFTMAWHAPADAERIEYDGGWVPVH